MSDTTTNGALFFTQLEGYLVALHDRGVVNENRLMAVFKDLLDDKPLTLDLLAGIFGIEPIFNLAAPSRSLSADGIAQQRREDAYRTAAIAGAGTLLDTSPECIVRHANTVIRYLKQEGVL